MRGGKHWSGYGARSLLRADLAVWNLLWLSDPTVDELLTWAPAEVLSAPLHTPTLQACMETADQVLGAHTVRTLVTYLLPVKFCERLRLDPKLIKTLNLHKLLGAAWLPAMERRAADYRGVLESNGRVVQVNFSKRPATNLQVGPKLNAAILTLE